MRKFLLFFLLVALISSLSGCSESRTDLVSVSQKETIDYLEKPDHKVIIGISVGEDGYYVLMSDTTLEYYEGEIVSIEIDDPALLAFKVSSDRGGGVYLVDKPDGDAMVDKLTNLMEDLNELGLEDLTRKVEEILDILNCSGPITSAST